MRIKLFIIGALIFLTSCTSYISVVNRTDTDIETISVLKKEDQSNFNLTHSNILDKNLLREPLKPSDSIKIKKRSYISIVALTDNFDSYIKNNIQKNKIVIDSLNYNLDTAMPLEDPVKINLKISNQSTFTIEKIYVKFYYPFSKKTKKESIMSSYNVIFPGEVVELDYDYYASSLFKMKEVIIQGKLGNKSYEKTYSENFTNLIVYK
jgi:hypothetical protein